MLRDRQLPSPFVLVFVLVVVAAVAFVATRPQTDRDRERLLDAAEVTFARGGSVTATSRIASDSVNSSNAVELTTPSGSSTGEFSDYRNLIQSLNLAVDIQNMGIEDLNGFSTTHYTATLDDDLAQEDLEDRVSIGDLKARPSRIDVWIDGSGYIQRFVLNEWFDPTGDGVLDSSVTLDFEYGGS